MDPDTASALPPPDPKPPLINYVLSFLLVGVAWGFTTPFIRRAAADFNKRQEGRLKGDSHRHEDDQGAGEGEGTELLNRNEDGNDDDDDDDDKKSESSNGEGEGKDDIHIHNTTTDTQAQSSTSATTRPSSTTATPAWAQHPSKLTWLKTKLSSLIWTIINLLRTPAYLIPLVINLTGSIWFFLLVGKHELSLTVPLANSSAFLFTVLGEWYVERKVIAKQTWLGMILVLAGIGICVQAKD